MKSPATHGGRPHPGVRTLAAITCAAAFALVGLVGPVGNAAACGYDDPHSVAMGALNLAYPDALHVGTAVWQAQGEGLLPPELAAGAAVLPRSFAAPLDPPGVAADGAAAALVDALRLLEQVRTRLAHDERRTQRPALAVVFASTVLWTRFTPEASGVRATPHASGPEVGDVVLVTEALVLRALVAGTLSPDLALKRGLLRFYGEAAAVGSARQWLAAMAAPVLAGSNEI